MGNLRSIVGGVLGTLMLALGVSVYIQKSRVPAENPAQAEGDAKTPLRAAEAANSAQLGGTTSLTGGITPAKPLVDVATQHARSRVLDVDGPTPNREKWSVSTGSASTRPWDPADSVAGTAKPSPSTKPSVRLHKVIDGDTLEKLAQRYLSDERQTETIFQANRQILIRRDLLPIGMTLTIPLAESADTPSLSGGDTLVQVRPPAEIFPGRTVSTAEPTRTDGDSDLVPVRKSATPDAVTQTASPWRASVGR
jgi:nucleoid-associated protein YgaU